MSTRTYFLWTLFLPLMLGVVGLLAPDSSLLLITIYSAPVYIPLAMVAFIFIVRATKLSHIGVVTGVMPIALAGLLAAMLFFMFRGYPSIARLGGLIALFGGYIYVGIVWAVYHGCRAHQIVHDEFSAFDAHRAA